MGKILIETRGDVQEGVDMAYLAAGEGRRLYGVTTPSEMPNKWAMSVRVPIGVVGVITAWNFPFAVPTWKIFPGIARRQYGRVQAVRGNTRDGLAAGEAVRGSRPACGRVQCRAWQWRRTSAGRWCSTQASTWCHSPAATRLARRSPSEGARLGKRVSLEMGGKNGVIVMDDADLSLAANAVAWGAFGTTGQRCTATSRVIVHERVHDELVKLVVQRAQALEARRWLERRRSRWARS